MGATDIWYKSITLPAGTRFTYRLVPDAPQAPGLARDVAVMAVARADPLSARRWTHVQYGDDFTDLSLVELPGSASHAAVDLLPGVPPGKVEQLRYLSAALQNERDLSIFLPSGYRPDCGPYDLMVLFDGEAYIAWVPAPVILANLIAQKKIAPRPATADASSACTAQPKG